jgi:hypothetical protein
MPFFFQYKEYSEIKMDNDQSTSHASLSSRQPRIEWVWKSNADPWGSEPAQWCAFSDVETAIIEEASQQKLPEAVLDNYYISFKDFVQVSKDDTSKQRPVKRMVNKEENKLREARFMPNPINPSYSFGHYFLGGFRKAAHMHFNLPGFAYTYENNSLENAVNRRRMVQKAAEGILIEGKMVGKQCEAQWLAQQLLNVIDGTAKEVWRVCARLYAMESFLYKKLNECMRLEGDEEHEQLWKSKVATFGPFSLLLYYLGEYTSGEMTVYRGCNLNDDLIQQYRQKMLTEPHAMVVFPAFTSTSKNRNKAEQFGNVLLVMDIDRRYDGSDVSPYSPYDEEEYLLAPYFAFSIRSCEFIENKNRWVIHLRSVRFE